MRGWASGLGRSLPQHHHPCELEALAFAPSSVPTCLTHCLLPSRLAGCLPACPGTYPLPVRCVNIPTANCSYCCFPTCVSTCVCTADEASVPERNPNQVKYVGNLAGGEHKKQALIQPKVRGFSL